MAVLRETAHRVYADEYNASRHEIKGQGEKDPSFLVTPTGAKVNRLHVVGVCTDVEPVGESGEVFRARISDPTGVFTVYAGQYQPEAAQVLASLQPPCFVAVTGKARSYEPEPGSFFVSLRPETVAVVDEATRDHWVVETARRTMERLQAVDAVRDEERPTAEALAAGGVRGPVAEGVLLAHEGYGPLDSGRYWRTVRTALEGLLPGGTVPVHATEGSGAGPSTPHAPAAPPAWKPDGPQSDPAAEALDDAILETVKRLEGDAGARWDDILDEAQKGAAEGQALTAEDVEEALNRLMDKGLVYEPTLGVLRTT